jgi:hypothetical protein
MDISVYFGWCRVEITEMESNGSNGFYWIYSMAYTLIMLVLYSLWDDVCRTHYVG